MQTFCKNSTATSVTVDAQKIENGSYRIHDGLTAFTYSVSIQNIA